MTQFWFVFIIFSLSEARINTKIRRLPIFISSDLCESELCFKDAYNLVSSLNTSMDPCIDFYEFACGNWPVKNKRPDSQPTWSQWEILEEKLHKNIKSILEYKNFETENIPLKAAKKLYENCINYDKMEENNALELKSLLDHFGGWPILTENWNVDVLWYQRISEINANLNISPLLKFHVSTNLYDTSEHVLYVDEPSLIYPEWLLLDPISYKIQIENYVDWIYNSTIELATLNNINLLQSKVKEDAREIVDFEIKIAKLISLEEQQNLTTLFRKMTIKKLKKTTDLLQLQHYYNAVPWFTVFETILKNTSINIQKLDKIIVKNLSYIIKLIKLLDNTPPRVIANYIGWNIIQYFSKETTQNLTNFIFQIDKTLSGVDEFESREKHCLTRIKKDMSLTINFEYIEQYFPPEIQKEINTMLDNIKNELEAKLVSLSWLDEATRKIAIEKANLIGYLIGYPENLRNLTYVLEYYKDVSKLKIFDNNIKNIISWNKFIRRKEFLKLSTSADNDKWFTITTDINAYYSVLQNLVIVPAGILQYPFYKKGRLNALNYGAFGTILAHEFSHAFDNTGRQVDMFGNLKQWWSQKSIDSYEKNTDCIEKKYHSYIKDFVLENFNKEIQMETRRAQDENIADILGLQIAYKAYIRSLGNTPDFVLPGLEKYTMPQLFFMSYANIWCESTSPEQFLTQILDSNHVPNKIRILGALSENEDFRKVFNCPIDTSINTKEKCLL